MAEDLISCPACRAEISAANVLRVLSGGFSLYHCDQCDLKFWSPRELKAAYYEESVLYHEHSLGSTPVQRWHKSFFRYFDCRRDTDSLLDVGCGDGAFLAETRSQFQQVYGVEFNRSAVLAAQTKRRLPNIYSCELTQLKNQSNPPPPLDVVTFFEVLEHQSDPRAFLQAVTMLLKRSGRIAGTVPNRKRFMISREESDYPPHHFLWWSAESLRTFLQSNGFKNIEIQQHNGFADTAAYVEYQLLGSVGNAVRDWVKKRYLVNYHQSASALSVDAIQEMTGKSLPMLKFLRRLRPLLFAVPTALMFPWIRSNLYFQAERS